MMSKSQQQICRNMCLKAYLNVKRQVMQLYKLTDDNDVEVLYDKNLSNKLLNFVKKVTSRSIVSIDERNFINDTCDIKIQGNLRKIDISSSFISSILCSKKCRYYQKQLVEHLVGEIFLSDVFELNKDTDDLLLSNAITFLMEKYTAGFISHFIISGDEPPRLDEEIKKRLLQLALDTRYTYLVESDIWKKAEFLYERDFKTIIPKLNESKPVVSTVEIPKSRVSKPKSKKVIVSPMELAGITRKHKRKLIDLLDVNDDIYHCSKASLREKKQFAVLEAMSKRKFIYDYYDEHVTDLRRDVHYMKMEKMLFVKLTKTLRQYTDDESLIMSLNELLSENNHMKPYDVIHNANTIYAAMLGFKPDDGDDSEFRWIDGAIRCAYSQEGMARFRLGMIEDLQEQS